MKKKVLLSSIMTIALCLCLIAGSTFALFTSNVDVNVAVTAGKVKVIATIDTESLEIWSLYEAEEDARKENVFPNGGTATFTEGNATLVLDRLTPGDAMKFTIDVTNESNVHVQYRVRMMSEPVSKEDGTYYTDLTDALVATAIIDGREYRIKGNERATVWADIEQNSTINDINVKLEFPNTEEDQNEYQEARANIYFIVEAVQGNAATVNEVYDTVVTTPDDLQKALLDTTGGTLNGNGATVALDTMIFSSKATYTLENITIDASSMPYMNSDGSENPCAIGAEGVDIMLSTGATVKAPTNGTGKYGVYMAFWYGEPNALYVNEGAKVVASGAGNACVWVLCSNVDIHLYDKTSLTAQDGAAAIFLTGTTVNVYVPDADVMDYYDDLIVTDGTASTVNWYIGDATTPVTTYY